MKEAVKAPLTRERIALAGIAIADSEGIEAVSMRRVAAALNVSTMSSYRHVRDRDDLIVAMVDTITARSPLPRAPEVSWSELVRIMAIGDWQAFTRHPWLISVWSTPRRRVDSASLDQLELVLERLERAGIGRSAGYAVIFGVAGLTLGMAALAIDDPGEELKSGVDLREWRRREGVDLDERAATDHRRAARFVTELHDYVGGDAFSVALEGFIGGIAVLHEAPHAG
ncbi:TetR family transcriptional regulator [Prescottella agglutinans]|uniref:TetR family transcriptional regulator n=1 Tax=Prescottella agglutinans TaxID=1644129 RepID=A0A3S3ANW2_9NOCA|nr:TetR/AcrR family transcriptional regulator C-terminal domain-containing protein [Prescottella agglutinans]RVW09285.1 TetR family transcriptional regulator [Prescottella agglutinans]